MNTTRPGLHHGHLAALLLTLVTTPLMLTALTGGSTRSQEDAETAEARTAMADFLTLWLVDGDGQRTKAYFSTSNQATQLTPRWTEPPDDPSLLPERYWDFINNVWEPEARWRTGRDTPATAGVTDALIRTFENELDVDVISSPGDTFIAFEASNAMSIDTFDASSRDARTVLRRSGRRTLGMLTEIPTRTYAGPFVAFWQVDDDGEWRIQMVGAIRP
ncbi:MAG: hypothetical protein OXG35_30670 [Acidobacteria bacterium]|nr:hypothetical protein [Acidobacteriota bacterium]